MVEQVFKDEQMIADSWSFLGSEEALPDTEQPVVFPCARWLEQHEQCIEYPGLKGLALANTDSLSQLVPDLALLQLICIDFPAPGDGRGYSLARILRERYDYRGELRAIGAVQLDQLHLLKRVGFNAFTLPENQHVSEVAKFMKPFSASYQLD